jgi:paraquat-inducible protein B
MEETPEVKVEVKTPEKTDDIVKEDDKSWLMKIGELTAKVENLEKEQTAHKTWLETLSHDVEEEQKRNLLLTESWEAERLELSRRLAELEAMEVIEEIAETIPEPEPEETVIEPEPEPEKSESRKRPPLIV